jgi:GTP diphosphokinase / guanosine-3',5'-bis(diphosphate) 3'-diphosphatase
LPSGSTPVDFAYAVPTDIGNTCVACRVNERMAPLSQPLQSGQKVAIITAQGAQPNPNWLNFVISAKARSGIRHYLKHQRHHQSVALGKRMLNRALADIHLDLDHLTEDQQLLLLHSAQLESLESLYEAIGMGNRVAHTVTRILQSETDAKPRSSAINSAITIDSAEGMMISYARCCRPIPGDPIIGHISSGKGLVIHQDTCRNIAEIRNNPEKISLVNWAPTVSGEFLVDVRVEVESERGIIATLATRITEQSASIEHINVHERDAHNSIIHLCIGVQSRIHLANIMRRIRNLSFVIRVNRSKN